MNVPSLKNRKPPVYIFLAIYSLCCAFFLIESSFPGNLSSQQSGAVSDVVAFFVNLFKDTTPAKKVEPLSLTLTNDSSFLNLADPTLKSPEIALGTTSLLTYTVKGPSLGKGEYLDPAFSAERNDSSTEEDYRLNVDSTSHSVYIVSTGKVGENYSISVRAGSEVTSVYSFKISANPAPISYSVAETGTSITLKENESYPLSLTLKDPRGEVKNAKNDYYLRRIYDPSKLAVTPSDPSAGLYVDEGGVIHAKKAGSYIAGYGEARVSVEVTSASLALPDSTSKLTISKSDSASKIALNDYDFYEANSKNGVDLVASWSGTLPGDTSVSWKSDDPLIGKIVPLQDGLKTHVNGYRKKGNVTLTAISNADPTVQASIVLSPEEIAPSEAEWHPQFRYSGGGSFVDLPTTLSVHKGEIITIKNTVDATKNITNNTLSATSDNSNVTLLGEGSQYITISFDKTGTSVVSLTSLGNASLKASLTLQIEAEQNVNADDATFQSFIRKLVGHGSWFAITAVFGALFFAFYLGDLKKSWIGFLAGNTIGFSIAALSELIQHFVPQRYGAWRDVGIDMVGYLIGSLLMLLVFYLILFIRNKKKAPTGPKEEK
jgi:VanZ family protein